MIDDNKLFQIPYDDAIEASKDVVDLIYKNADYCQVQKIVADLDSMCNFDYCLDNVDLWKNIKDNSIQIFAKLEAVVQYFFDMAVDNLTDQESLKMCDQLGESYGAILSYIIGFNKRWN